MIRKTLTGTVTMANQEVDILQSQATYQALRGSQPVPHFLWFGRHILRPALLLYALNAQIVIQLYVLS